MAKLLDKRIAIRISVAQLEMIRWAAQARGLDVSQYMRACALEAAASQMVPEQQGKSNVYHD